MENNGYIKQFSESLIEIGQLIDTPETIREIAIKSLSDIKLNKKITNTERSKIDNKVKALKNISEESIKKHYQTIYNQVCVLAVSALSAMLEKCFIGFVQENYRKIDFNRLSRSKKIRISLSDIKDKYSFDIKNNLGRIIMENDNSINFQDLQATIRTFREYLEKDIELDARTCCNIAFYQQCRHVIVHKNGIVDKEFINRIKDTKHKERYKEGENIRLDKKDWAQIQKSFKLFLEKVIESLEE